MNLFTRPGVFSWCELMTRDPEEASSFTANCWAAR